MIWDKIFFILYMCIKFYILLIILLLLLTKKKETFKTKKTCLIGIVGLYRTFERTSNNIYTNIIKENPDYNFTIIVNTELENDDLIKKRDKNYEKIIYSKNVLEKKLKEKYGKFGNLKITYFSNKGVFKADLFKKRANKVIDMESKKYDMCIFIRPDLIINKPINIDNYNHEQKIYTIPSSNDSLTRFDHTNDFDLMLIGKFKLISKYFKHKSNLKILKKKDVIDLGKLNGNNGLFLRNYQKNITEFKIKRTSRWVTNWWLFLIDLYKTQKIILSFNNHENIKSKILRNYDKQIKW